jgi:hypothetical protein
MIDLTTGRGRRCKDALGGFDTVFLTPFVSYDNSQIVTEDARLIQFPGTFIYEFKVLNANLSESPTEDGGGKFVNQTLSFDLSKVNVESNEQLIRLIKKDYRALIFDRNGFYRIVGLYNGIRSEMTKTTGSGKADFSGYKITMDATENDPAFFIDDLDDLGFIVPGTVQNYIFQDSDNFIFQDGDNYIFN